MNDYCLIILSYMESVDASLAQSIAEKASYIIAADGGQNRAREFALQPDCVIGDFDSTTLNEEFDCIYITYPTEKDITDTEAALDHAREKGYSRVIVLGGIGGRLDHTLGNIGMLCKYSSQFRHLLFLDGKNSMELLQNSQRTLKRNNRYKYLGLVSLDEVATGIDIVGAKYELHEGVLPRASTLCVSNEFKEDQVTVRVRNGRVLILRSSDQPKNGK